MLNKLGTSNAQTGAANGSPLRSDAAVGSRWAVIATAIAIAITIAKLSYSYSLAIAIAIAKL